MIVRVKKDKDYAVMSNYHFKDKILSLRAKGLLSLMLSLPNKWDYSINGLCSICNELRITIRNILKELRYNHYLEMNENRDEKGKFIDDYIVYEIPNIHRVIFALWFCHIRIFIYN